MPSIPPPLGRRDSPLRHSPLRRSASATLAVLSAAIRFRCPACRLVEAELRQVQAAGWSCTRCGALWRRREGVIDALPAEARERHARYLEDRGLARQPEDAQTLQDAELFELPFVAARAGLDWPARARAWRCFERRVLAPLERDAGRPLDIVDVGAGVGWLSYRLALRGHRPIAVDLSDDSVDGLGAARRFAAKLDAPFPAIQAELDNLPLADDQLDLVVYNGSFHHAVDYRETLREARRALGWGGRVVVLGTPLFRGFQDGEAMVERRQAAFERRHGRPPRELLSMGYLDEDMLRALEREVGVRWSVHKPWSGPGGRLDELLARWSGRRSRARAWVLVGSWTTV